MTTKRRKIPDLHELLRYRRAHNSPGEKQYILDHIQPLKPHIVATAKEELMAFFVYVGKSDILFTSHVDTVHLNSSEVFQEVLYSKGTFYKNDKQPLGADDAAGNWLMFHMIANKIPGVYAFFRGEERGGIGSTYCAEHRKDLFEGLKVAIAFDRKGTKSIITHQGPGRGCSDEFAESFGAILGLGHVPDDTGVYTDTAEFFQLIPNCTNISVGYLNEHSKKETLDHIYIQKLRDSLLAADWSKLDHTPPKPEIYDPKTHRYMQLDFMSQRSLFSDVPDDVSVLDIADYLFDHSDKLPRDLRDRALELSQAIYLRFE